jgi:hypothetical protein
MNLRPSGSESGPNGMMSSQGISLRSLLGRVSLPSHVVKICWDLGTHSQRRLQSGHRGKFYEFDSACERTDGTEVVSLVIGTPLLGLSTACNSFHVTTL